MSDKLPPLPHSIARVLHGDEPVYFASQMHAYAEQHAAELSKTIGELRAEVMEQARLLGMSAERELDLRGRMGVLVGLLREARKYIPSNDLLDRIDDALGQATDDLEDEPNFWRCTVCGRVGAVGRCCGEETREPVRRPHDLLTGEING